MMIILKYGLQMHKRITKKPRYSKKKYDYKTMRLSMDTMINDLSKLTIYNRLSNEGVVSYMRSVVV